MMCEDPFDLQMKEIEDSKKVASKHTMYWYYAISAYFLL
jgi:hypothetical protein